MHRMILERRGSVSGSGGCQICRYRMKVRWHRKWWRSALGRVGKVEHEKKGTLVGVEDYEKY